MKDKIISFMVGILIGGIIVFGYNYFITKNNPILTNSTQGFKNNTGKFNTGSLTDTQLEKMSERTGLTKEELKKKIDSGEDIRSLMRGNKSNNN